MTRKVPPARDDETHTLAGDGGSGQLAAIAYLIVYAGTSSRRFDLPRAGEVVIGRGTGADLRIEAPAISRAHARIVIDGSSVTLVDLGSHNGTLQNGQRIAEPRPLASGDVIQLGEVALVFNRGGRADLATGQAKHAEASRSTEAATEIRVGDQSALAVDPAMVRLFALLARLGPTDLPVLIHGETGTGKEIAAAMLHDSSPRRTGPLIAINCAAVPDTLIESELFGYEKGAFSGATAPKRGRFEAADGGTLFLDEVGDLSAAAQAKLLRALESRKVARLGGTSERAIDVRLIAATHRDLRAEMEAGRFRGDLYFRLGSATVVVPPLRDRPRDIPLLATRFLDEARARLKRTAITLAPSAMQALLAYPWPGNVRELKNTMDYVAATAEEEAIEATALPPALHAARPARPDSLAQRERVADELRAIERARMAAALEETGGNQSRAAELIGMPRRTFVTRLKEYGLGGASRKPGG